MTLQLHVTRGLDQGTRFSLETGRETVIGRGLDCGVRLADPAVSRRHCRIVVEGSQATLYDIDSQWGTLVNGRRVEFGTIRPGDRIAIGETELQFHVVGSPDAATIVRPDDFQDGAEAANGKQIRRRTIPDPTQLAGTRFARFDVQSLVARAQTGVVFRAYEMKKERIVALKVFYPENFQDGRQMQRFLRAVRTMLPMRHENLVALHRAGRSQRLCYTACEFVEGESAAQLIQRIGIGGMLEWQHAFRMAVHMAHALEVAERHGIIHRNVTPRNILIRSSDRLAKLGDLVLARAMEGTRQEQITRPGELVGQLEYLSPEQSTGARLPDTRSDIYSLGATLYAVLTGRSPFEGRSPAETILKIQTEKPVKPTEYHLSIPSLFEDTVLRMLAKRPEDRPQTANKLLKELRRVAKYQGCRFDDPTEDAFP